MRKAKKDDKEFLSKFVETQMFVTLVEDHFSKMYPDVLDDIQIE